MDCGKAYSKHLLDRLNSDAEFQRRIDSDAALKEILSASSCEPELERDELLTVLGGKCFCGEFAFNPPTPGSIALLWLAKSPFVHGGKVRLCDVDAALRVFILGPSALDGIKSGPQDIEALSLGLHASLGLSAESALKAVSGALRIAFRAFEMIPRQPGADGDAVSRFDADWLTWLVAAVSSVSNLTPRSIVWRLPMAEAAYYVAQSLRRNGVKGVKHMPHGEKLFGRLNELMDERLKELKLA